MEYGLALVESVGNFLINQRTTFDPVLKLLSYMYVLYVCMYNCFSY